MIRKYSNHILLAVIVICLGTAYYIAHKRDIPPFVRRIATADRVVVSSKAYFVGPNDEVRKAEDITISGDKVRKIIRVLKTAEQEKWPGSIKSLQADFYSADFYSGSNSLYTIHLSGDGFTADGRQYRVKQGTLDALIVKPFYEFQEKARSTPPIDATQKSAGGN